MTRHAAIALFLVACATADPGPGSGSPSPTDPPCGGATGTGTVEPHFSFTGGGGDDIEYHVVVRVDGGVVDSQEHTEGEWILEDVPTGLVEVEVTNGSFMDDITGDPGGSGSTGLNGQCYYGCAGLGSGRLCPEERLEVTVVAHCESESCD